MLQATYINESETNVTANEGRDILELGKTYDILSVNIHSWYTEIVLKDFPGKIFNSVQFAMKPFWNPTGHRPGVYDSEEAFAELLKPAI